MKKNPFPQQDEIFSADYQRDERNFFKVYNDIIKVVSHLTGPEAKFILVIAGLMDWNNKIILDEVTKIKLISYIGYTNKNSINNLCTSLCKKGFLTRTAPNEYVVNNIFITKQAEPMVRRKRELEAKKREEFCSKLFSI